ncbi:MAG: UDP-N-acetylmuramoyl-L-alanyl-D-glutamate--2,6-diaminopimelate ligase [Desulfobulbus sp.]|nr:MAG: UDP-N-acetylmuramoyl-L-alanyl-D-glutamate--2,6-diaminopimelate ligase [Desulfobulbus sp.]
MDFQSLTGNLPAGLAVKKLQVGRENRVHSITVDSRKAGPGSVFVALEGSSVDGHLYVVDAVRQGCSSVVVEKSLDSLPGDVNVIQVNDSHAALGYLATSFYGSPAQKMTMIGITGTNGKTTVSWMIEQMLQSNGYRVGVIGTIDYRYPDANGDLIREPAPLTTPDPIRLQRLLRAMADHGVTHVVMETSSHALVQERLQGIIFDIVVFTNLSRDHLDYHGDMEEYFAAKKNLFSKYLKHNGCAVVVTDVSDRSDNYGKRLHRELSEGITGRSLISCGFTHSNDVSVRNLQETINGFSCQLVAGELNASIRSGVTGRYNVLNTLAAAGVGVGLGFSPQQIVNGLENLSQVPGRLERVKIPGLPESGQPAVFVDYAHTPDALENVLQTLKKLTSHRLVCVFGCGGDRDKGKRSLMGKIAATHADIAIVTSDNPRSEQPESIIASIAEGLKSGGSRQVDLEKDFFGFAHAEKSYTCITNREKAIAYSIAQAAPGDIVLVAGKGHETYQQFADKKVFFDDRLCALDAMICWNRTHLLNATGGQVQSGKQSALLNNISTDTRKLQQGDIFVALAGETYDGHDYIDTAVKAGAAAVVVHQEISAPSTGILVIRVEDTQKALSDLAAYRRGLLTGNVQVTAITGSSGKTTVKEMTSAIFNNFFSGKSRGGNPLLKTEGNFNNLIGLPLSLLPLSAGHQKAVLEMGMNRPGEIERLAEIADPDIACITNVQAAHLEGLGDIRGVAKAKGELFARMRPETVAVVNYDDPHVRKLRRSSANVLGFAVTQAGRRLHPTVRASRIVNLGEQGMRFTLQVGDRKKRITVPAPGVHNVSNCAAAAAIACAAGVPFSVITEALQEYRSMDKRMQFMTLPGGVLVVNDCYNANPASMEAALTTVSSFGDDCKRIALLGDMLELGDDSIPAHVEVGRKVAECKYDELLVTGTFAGHVAAGAEEEGMSQERLRLFSDHEDIVDWIYKAMIQGKIVEGDWLLVKGSRGMQMEKVLQGLEQRFATGIERKR